MEPVITFKAETANNASTPALEGGIRAINLTADYAVQLAFLYNILFYQPYGTEVDQRTENWQDEQAGDDQTKNSELSFSQLTFMQNRN